MSEEIARAVVRIEPDLTGFREEVDAKVGAATPPVKVKVEADTAPARGNVDALKASLDSLSARVATARANVNDDEAKAKLLAINAQLLRIGERVANPKIDVRGVAEAEAQLAALDLQLRKVAQSSDDASVSLHKFDGGVSAMGLGIAAALPFVPVLTGGVIGLGAVLTAAGTAGVGFGAVVETAFKQAQTASQQLTAAQQAVDNATTAKARETALEKQAALIQQLGPNVIALAQAEKDVTQQWKDFADSFTPQLTTGVSLVQKLAADVLPQLRPMIDATFGVLDTDLQHLDAAATSSGGQGFFHWLSVQGPHDLLLLTDAAGKFGAGLAHIAEAFTPVENQLVQGIDNIAARFDAWSSNLSGSAGFQSFLAEVQKDGPEVVHTLGDVASAFGHIGLSLGSWLPDELKLVDSIAKLVAEHPALAATLAAAYEGFQAMKVIGAITGPLGTLINLSKDGIGWFRGLGGAADAAAVGTAAVGTAAAGAEAPTGLFLGTVGDFEPVAFGAASGVTAFAGAEVFAGTAAAGAEPAVATLGATMDATAGKASVLLSLLSRIGVAAAGAGAAAAAVTYGPLLLTSGDTAKNQVKDYIQGSSPRGLGDLLNQVLTENKGKIKGGFDVSKTQAIDIVQRFGSPIERNDLYTITGGAYGIPSIASTVSGTINSSGSDLGHGVGVINDRSEYNDQVPGTAGSDYGNPQQSYLGEFYNQLNNPANFLPLSNSSGSKAAQTAAQNNAAALAYLLGISVPNSLAQGIAAGTNPLTQTFQNLNQKLSGTAQTLANTLEQTFNTALSYGQKAAQTLEPNLINGLPQFGTMTNVTVGPDGKLVSTQVSPILAGLQTVLGNDKTFVNDINQARALGLSQTLLNQFIQAGPSSAGQLQALIGGGKTGIAQVNATYGQITGLANIYGDQQAAAVYLPQMVQQLSTLIAAVQAQAPQLAAALNGAAKSGMQLAHATPSLGALSRG